MITHLLTYCKSNITKKKFILWQLKIGDGFSTSEHSGEAKNYSREKCVEKYLWPVFLVSSYTLAGRGQWESIAVPAAGGQVNLDQAYLETYFKVSLVSIKEEKRRSRASGTPARFWAAVLFKLLRIRNDSGWMFHKSMGWFYTGRKHTKVLICFFFSPSYYS